MHSLTFINMAVYSFSFHLQANDCQEFRLSFDLELTMSDSFWVL